MRAFRPAPVAADWRERMRVVLGATLGILVTALVTRTLGGSNEVWPWLIAPMGATAVLVFAVPASPLAQRWAVLGGNTLSALAGIACARWIGSPEWAAALAVGLAIGVMFSLRCLHPPGGASALLVALNGVSDPGFALLPVFANSFLLVVVGMAYNHATRRAYPHMQLPNAPTRARDDEIDEIDAHLDAVLARYNQVLDISRDDLRALIQDAQLSTHRIKLSKLRCSDIMSRELVTVSRQTPLQQAWSLFRKHRIKALPVVDAAGGIVGIVTPVDFMRDAGERGGADFDTFDKFDTQRRRLRGWIDGTRAPEQELVGQIMTRRVRVASERRHLTELIPLFRSTGHHHIPIIDAEDRLVGIVTQSDVISALSRTEPQQARPQEAGAVVT